LKEYNVFHNKYFLCSSTRIGKNNKFENANEMKPDEKIEEYPEPEPEDRKEILLFALSSSLSDLSPI